MLKIPADRKQVFKMTNQALILVRRCEVLLLEPEETVEFEFESLLTGGDGLCRTLRWRALAPHLAEPVEIDANQRELIGRVSPSRWTAIADFAGKRT